MTSNLGNLPNDIVINRVFPLVLADKRTQEKPTTKKAHNLAAYTFLARVCKEWNTILEKVQLGEIFGFSVQFDPVIKKQSAEPFLTLFQSMFSEDKKVETQAYVDYLNFMSAKLKPENWITDIRVAAGLKIREAMLARRISSESSIYGLSPQTIITYAGLALAQPPLDLLGEDPIDYYFLGKVLFRDLTCEAPITEIKPNSLMGQLDRCMYEIESLLLADEPAEANDALKEVRRKIREAFKALPPEWESKFQVGELSYLEYFKKIISFYADFLAKDITVIREEGAPFKLNWEPLNSRLFGKFYTEMQTNPTLTAHMAEINSDVTRMINDKLREA